MRYASMRGERFYFLNVLAYRIDVFAQTRQVLALVPIWPCRKPHVFIRPAEDGPDVIARDDRSNVSFGSI